MLNKKFSYCTSLINRVNGKEKIRDRFSQAANSQKYIRTAKALLD